jgi:N-acetylglucosamine kinase-like BadF-type ATPase
MIGLGLDAGGSATRWVLAEAGGAIIAAGELQPVSGHLYNPPERETFERMAATLRVALGHRRPSAVIAGITGLSAESPQADIAAALIAAALDIPAARVRVQDDMWIAYHAVFAPGAGHIVYCGTGSVAIHIRADGTLVRAGGRGILIDDAGSAFWIGREALNLVLRQRDVDPAATSPLAAGLFAAIGSDAWEDIRAHVYGGGRTAVAMLARAVAAADDAGARVLLHRAGAELARLAEALVAREGARPVALLGRAATLHPAILAGFSAASPQLDVQLQSPDAAAAAARLAAAAN